MTTVYDIDATGQSLGRIATRIAVVLRGKNTPAFQPNIIPDNAVVIRNLNKVVFSGSKAQTTRYYRHSGYPGGIRERTMEQKWAANPREVLRLAVRGMLAPNRQRDRLLKHISYAEND